MAATVATAERSASAEPAERPEPLAGRQDPLARATSDGQISRDNHEAGRALKSLSRFSIHSDLLIEPARGSACHSRQRLRCRPGPADLTPQRRASSGCDRVCGAGIPGGGIPQLGAIAAANEASTAQSHHTVGEFSGDASKSRSALLSAPRLVMPSLLNVRLR